MDFITTHFPTILSVLPLLVFIILLLVKRTSLLTASSVTLGIYTLLVIFYWKILPHLLWASFGKGIFIAFDIFIIIFGAIFFLTLLEKLGNIKNISYYLEHFSRDYRLQIILLAWLFSAFLEGTAGFGTSVAVVAPLLVGLGLTPIRALVVSLIGNSVPGVFGAVGTPIKVGFAGLDTAMIPLMSALINCAGFIIPVFMLWAITKGRENRKKEFLEALPFAIWTGIAFVVPSVFSVFLGQEFPSIVGAVVGIIIVYITTKLGLFVPSQHISLQNKEELRRTMHPLHAFLPYILLIVFLILGKIFIGNMGINIDLGFPYKFNLFNPGFVFILVGLLVALIMKSKKEDNVPLISNALKSSFGPFIVISSTSAFVQLMINSGTNTTGISSSITYLAKIFESNFLPFFTPFISAFGSFITGSVTVSNIMFGNFFNTAGAELGYNTAVILSLAVVGAAAGNMIALADMLAAQAVLGVKNQEHKILKGVLIPCITFLIIVGIIGMLIS